MDDSIELVGDSVKDFPQVLIEGLRTSEKDVRFFFFSSLRIILSYRLLYLTGGNIT